MTISIVSFTENGKTLSKKLKACLEGYGDKVWLFTKCSSGAAPDSDVKRIEQSIGDWAGEQMRQKHVLVFVGACGIAVRAIAGHLGSKLEDSPVLVIDEKGIFVIPILSGHFGGANELAVLFAEKLGAEPVITTATDINQKFAIDVFAKKNKLTIMNKDGIARVSSKVLRGDKITISIENGHAKETKRLPEEIQLMPYPPEGPVDVVITSESQRFDALITLKPQVYIIGAGCRKEKEPEKLEEFIGEILSNADIKEQEVAALASIDIKADEVAFKQWSNRRKIPLLTYSREELEGVEGTFSESEFVKQTVGVGNVCERSALMAAGTGGRLVLEKTAEDGMTVAIAKREWSVTFDEI